MKPLVVTTSWDDGYPADLRVAELLAKHGAAGTFYVPNRNSEGRPVMSEDDVRRLSQRFELGGHSIDHIVLTELTPTEAERQIVENKRWLEDVTGGSVRGFCYVRGRYNQLLKEIVKRAGFEYARTVENLHGDAAHDLFELPTTIQLYPHTKRVYLTNFLKGELSVARARLLWAAISADDLETRIARLIDACEVAGGVFHIWGHSWELEELELWDVLDAALKRFAAAPNVVFAANHDVARRAVERARASDATAKFVR